MVAGFWPAQLVVAATLCETVDLRRLNGPLAQRLEQWTHNPLVPGSNPGGPTKRHTVGNSHAASFLRVTAGNNAPLRSCAPAWSYTSSARFTVPSGRTGASGGTPDFRSRHEKKWRKSCLPASPWAALRPGYEYMGDFSPVMGHRMYDSLMRNGLMVYLR